MEELSGRNILVVGGAGFVGSNLVRAIVTARPGKVTVVDNLLSAERVSVPDSSLVEFVEGPITSDRILGSLEDEFEYVFHLATYHGNQNSRCNPLADHENNTLSTLKLYERIKSFKRVRKVVYSSAGCTVAEKTFDKASATVEDAPVSLYLDSPYQMSKIFGEFYSNYYWCHLGLPVVKARFQNVYGPGEILGAGQWRGTPATVWRNVVPSFVYRAVKHMPLIIENQGIATRDFIYVSDIVRGLIVCAIKGEPGEVYNLATGVETSIKDLADMVNRLAENPVPIELGPKRNWDNSGKRLGSTEKAAAQIGFRAAVALEKGLTETIRWTRENIELIDSCIAKHRHLLDASQWPVTMPVR